MRISPAQRLIFAVAMTFFVHQVVAQTVANLYGGYSFLSNDLHIAKQIGESGTPTATGRANLNGWNISGEIRVFRWIGVVADFDGSYGSAPGTGLDPFLFKPPIRFHTSFYSYLFGPRVSVEIGRFRPFAEGLLGVASQNVKFTSFESADDSHLAVAYGGGLDYRISRRLGWRIEADYIGSRLFHDPLLGTSTPVQHNFRLSTGIVFRL